jgi:hypothetical protein
MLLLSYSGIRQFCNCRRAYKLRYHDNLTSIHEPEALTFGKAWHEILESYYRCGASMRYKVLNNTFDESLILIAMKHGYAKQFNDEGFKLNNRRAMRGVRFRGVIDLVIERDDGIWIMEHKTAASIDGAYIDKLWHDLQIMLYAYAYQEMTGKKVRGVIYNVAKKSRIRQRQNETEEQFQDRLIEVYQDKSMYHREEILCDERRLKEVQGELWDICKEIKKAKNLYKNRAQCFMYNRECEYFKICNSGGSEIVIDNFYKEREER